MATDALSIPFDITWQRLAYSADMIDRSFGGGLPPKWRSSTAVYIYPVPLADTVDEYPDHRIFYLKVSASITGWSPREELEGMVTWLQPQQPGVPPQPPAQWDSWQTEGWTLVDQSPTMTRSYWPCVGALLQVAIYPRPEAGVAVADYPSIVDFEPKKRELYEAVSDAHESLSGSGTNLNTRKGKTTTHSLEAKTNVHLPLVGETGLNYGYRRENVDVTTTDASTERRETAGRTTQLSQMYQLFNGYHLGTNRGLFVVFPRPHIVSSAEQTENSLINGQRKLEGVQDVFLVVQVPRSVPGICVRTFLDTAHEGYPENGLPPQVVVTRRSVAGCGEWQGDRLALVPPPAPSPAPPRMVVVGEHQIGGGWQPSYKYQVKAGRTARLEVANNLNQAAAEVRDALLADAASGAFRPVEFLRSGAFGRVAGLELRRSSTQLSTLMSRGYITSTELAELSPYGIMTVGALFSSGMTSPTITTVRQRLLDALASAPIPT